MTQQGPDEPNAAPSPEATPADAAQRLAALMNDLTELQTYLEERGNHTYELAQRFMMNARRDASSRAYDERQATMLEYQHYNFSGMQFGVFLWWEYFDAPARLSW